MLRPIPTSCVTSSASGSEKATGARCRRVTRRERLCALELRYDFPGSRVVEVKWTSTSQACTHCCSPAIAASYCHSSDHSDARNHHQVSLRLRNGAERIAIDADHSMAPHVGTDRSGADLERFPL